MVLVKNCKFFDIFISAKKRQENVFDDFLERENTFVDKKKMGYYMGFVKNWQFFHIFISAKK